ncbi:GNAT family N-acetyltransferase [Chlorogloeopsis fritschii PCC 6912]|uniref:GNAT family N-acetyltransferase n=1 Tax=Chlorogloeopsis fritschii PCC 6912 TaxID=211165 RepID=A0A3S0Y049_CHLFR|nr:GNAT family N-acetyltransferase [Chlorogloeopsis fritschii PCC 6912]
MNGVLGYWKGLLLNQFNTKLTLTSWFLDPFHQEPFVIAAEQASCHFQIRAATATDLIAVAQIIAESFHSQKGFWGWAFPLLRLGIYEDLRHRLASAAPHHICLVAVDTTTGLSDNLVGTVELGVRFNDSWTEVGRSFPYLSNLAVHPKYRRQGAASQLLAASEKIVREWGFEELYLHVLENNYQARQLYFKQGYRVHKVESTWNIFFLKRSQQILLHKHLLVD